MRFTFRKYADNQEIKKRILRSEYPLDSMIKLVFIAVQTAHSAVV